MATLKSSSEEFGTPNKFDLIDLTLDELELIQEGLIELKNNRLGHTADFIRERRMCTELYEVIDAAIIELKEA